MTATLAPTVAATFAPGPLRTAKREAELRGRFAAIGLTLVGVEDSKYSNEPQRFYRLKFQAPGDGRVYALGIRGIDHLQEFTQPEALRYLVYDRRYSALSATLELERLQGVHTQAEREYGDAVARQMSATLGYTAGSRNPQALAQAVRKSLAWLRNACEELVEANETVQATLGARPARPEISDYMAFSQAARY